ncbi:MAG TPA: crossover junction endodeoxyribonuclease RuvC [Polyangiales bacterium]
MRALLEEAAGKASPVQRAKPAASARSAQVAPAPARGLRVLGLDPGSVRTGWGVVEWETSCARGIAAGVIRVPESAPIAERLRRIHAGVCEVLAQHRPDAVAVEDIFFARYPRAALMLGHARGVAVLAAAQAELAVTAYPPAVVKRALVGSGRADKQQVAQLVGAVLGWKELPSVDATDALAIALTHLNASRLGR